MTHPFSKVPLLLCTLIVAMAGTARAGAPVAASATHWVQVGSGVMLRYEDGGKGWDTIVLLHELGTSLETWDYVVARLRRDHRVLRYDLRGFGLSSRIAEGLTMADEVADLDGLLARLDVRGPVTLIGGAVGGAIALDYAALHPDRVRGVVAISPAAYLQAREPGASPAQPRAGQAAPPPPPAAELTEASYPARFRVSDPARYARFLALTGGGNPESSRLTTAAVYRVGFAEVLPRIACPVLIVGTSLWLRPSASFRELAAVVPGGRFIELKTGHFAAMASPDLLLPVLTRFLAEPRPGPRARPPSTHP